MSKLSFRARALDASKSLPIYLADEIPENADCSLINRAVPQMPTGMEKEEESEHHLQRAICAGMVIPTPEVFDMEDLAYYTKLYPENYKMPRQLIYMQPFSMEADIPDYDMDSEDEHWVTMQAAKLELTPQKFEEMMDRLEKGSGQTVVTLQEAKALIKEDDDLIIAVYDYWLNKRLKTQHPLIPQVKTEARFGVSNHNPYIAFRRRTEKMQTRKNRKNDETSYEKMLKLKRDLSRAVTLLEMVKRREKSKRELLHLTIEVFEKRYQAGDFTGQIVNDALQQRPPRPAFTPLFQPNSMTWNKDDPLFSTLSRKEKRQYKKRRHKSATKNMSLGTNASSSVSTLNYNSTSMGYVEGEFMSSDEDPAAPASPSEGEEEEGAFAFRRKKNCEYHFPLDSGSPIDNGAVDERLLFAPTSISIAPHTYKSIGHARRRIGRGGRVLLDRIPHHLIDKLKPYSQQQSSGSIDSPSPVTQLNPNGLFPDIPSDSVGYVPTSTSANAYSHQQNYVHFRPKSPEPEPEDDSIDYSTDSGTDNSDDKYDNCTPFTLTPGSYIGAVVAKGDRPMVFSVETLLSETAVNTDPLPLHIESSPGEAVLLDEESANITNANYFASLNCAGDLGLDTGSWFPVESMDIGNEALDSFGSSTLHSININQFAIANHSSPRSTSEPMDVDNEVKIVDSDVSSVEIERRRLVDKDNKENDRVSTPGDREGGDSSIISENGDGVESSSEDCMIAEEPKSSVVNSSRGMSSSSTLLVDSVGVSGDGIDISNSLSKNLNDKSRTNTSNNQLFSTKNYPGLPNSAGLRRLYSKPRRNDGNSGEVLFNKRGNVNGDSDGNFSGKFGFNEVVPLELLSSASNMSEFSPDTDNNVETLEFGLGRSSKNFHLTVNSSNTSSNNNSISMVSSSGPGPAKILSNGPTVRSMPDCEQGSIVRSDEVSSSSIALLDKDLGQ